MSALLSSELLKLRTTRVAWGYTIAVAALTALAAAGTVGSARELERFDPDFQPDLVTSAGTSGLLALLLGITLVTNEFRHGTITPSLLVTPVRERFLAAKGLVAVIAGIVFATAGALVVAAIAIPWLTALDIPLQLGDGDVWLGFGRILLDAALWGAIGVGIGGLVHGQVGALVGTIIWLLLVEPLAGFLLELIELDFVAKLLLGRASGAITGSEGEDVFGFWPSLGIMLGYVAVLGALAVVRTRSRDVTG